MDNGGDAALEKLTLFKNKARRKNRRGHVNYFAPEVLTKKGYGEECVWRSADSKATCSATDSKAPRPKKNNTARRLRLNSQ